MRDTTATRCIALATFAAALGVPVRAQAHHRQTPPVVRVTTSGDNDLPRARPGWRRFALAIDPSRLDANGYLRPSTTFPQIPGQLLLVRSDWFKRTMQAIKSAPSIADPTISVSGFDIAWDADCAQLECPGDTGHQIVFWQFEKGFWQLTHDPSGTSVNPAISGLGNVVAFESRGDLAGSNAGGASQIFLGTAAVGTPAAITQVTRGSGTSRNAALSMSGRTLVFESSDDEDGNDTGESQIWVASSGAATRITRGAAPSTSPDVSIDGRLVVFQSTAAVAGDGHDTGVSQVFVYEVRAQTLTQLTDEPSGCSHPSVDIASRDRRVSFVCNGVAFYQLVGSGQRFRLPIPEGSDTRSVFGIGANFAMVSTTADWGCPACNGQACAVGRCTVNGVSSGHQLFVVNLWKLPAIEVTQPPASPSAAFVGEAPHS